MDVTVKTTGYLISEYITIRLKTKYAINEHQKLEASLRQVLLYEAIIKRICKVPDFDKTEFLWLYRTLYKALKECWDAQEVVMDSLIPDEVYGAAKLTLIKNKERNIAIRALDQFFGEQYYSHLEKTYKV